jgi:hypothetical protein
VSPILPMNASPKSSPIPIAKSGSPDEP